MKFEEYLSESTPEREMELKENEVKEVIDMADQQLEIVKYSLKDFVNKIIQEQPDEVIFMDKGARIFGEPTREYLETIADLPKMPEISFYNDQTMKGNYIKGQWDENFIEKEMERLRDKKVFFFDETFSNGKVAATIKKIKDALGNDDIYFFALTQDPNPGKLKEDSSVEISLKEHQVMLDRAMEDPKFKIYPNLISILFSKKASSFFDIKEREVDGILRTKLGTGDYSSKPKPSEVIKLKGGAKIFGYKGVSSSDYMKKTKEEREIESDAVEAIERKIFNCLNN